MIQAILFILCLLLSDAAFAQQQSLTCDSTEHRQLDFWVGEWNVVDQTTNRQVGTSTIEKRLNGCMIFESWKGSDDFQGHSFNLYNRETRNWQQVWVDSRGQRIDFVGELRSDGMYYQGPFRSGGKQVESRMTFLKMQDGKVRQLWEQSDDQGKSWKLLFDGLYVKVR